MAGELVPPEWPPLTLAEVDRLLRHYPSAGRAERLLSFSPRPFSAASLVQTPRGNVLVKRHSRQVRDTLGLDEEHRLMTYLADQMPGMIPEVLAARNGETSVTWDNWTYEVHALARGFDVYAEAQSWTPFFLSGHARAAGRALAKLHRAARDYAAPPRGLRPLIASYRIFAGRDPAADCEAYLGTRPLLREYAERRDWRRSLEDLLMPFYAALAPWLGYLPPLWTHNDFHASNLMWSGPGADAEVTAIIDFGLADRTNAMHDLAAAIERNVIEWLRAGDPGAEIVHLDHLDALLAGYDELSPISYEERRALAAMLPLAHCEFALSETDYFLSVLHSPEKAFLGYEGYFLAHAQWFLTPPGLRLREHLHRWAEEPRHSRGARECP